MKKSLLIFVLVGILFIEACGPTGIKAGQESVDSEAGNENTPTTATTNTPTPTATHTPPPVLTNTPIPVPDFGGDYVYEDFTYEADKVLRKVRIKRYRASQKEIVIPDTIDGMNVVGINAFTFEGNQDIEKVILPESLVEIGNYAFQGCRGLRSIVIPKNVTSILPRVQRT